MGMKAKYLAQDYEARLHGGVVMFGGIPFKADANNGVLVLRNITDGRVAYPQVDPNHEDLDIGTVPLGFINTPNGAIYMQRMPLRRYKQSLEARAMRECRLTKDGFVHDYGDGHSEYLFSKSFLKSFKERYPTLDEAIKMLEEVGSVALTREVAITRNNLKVINIWYKLDENPVGWVDYPKSRIIRVPSSDKAWIISTYLSELGWEVD